MKAGKISNTVFKRSVLKLIRSKNQDVINKPAIGVEYTTIKMDCTDTVISTGGGISPLINAANKIYAAGAKMIAAECLIVLPNGFEEKSLKSIVKELDDICIELGISLSIGHTQYSENVVKPVYSVTGIGKLDNSVKVSAANIKPDMDIIMTKTIGIGGIRRIIEQKKEDIANKYSKEVIAKAYGSPLDMLVAKEADIAVKNNVTTMYAVSEGGILAGLWNMAEAGNVGMNIYTKDIAVCQEAIEICEMYDINPYILESSGCLLMTSDKGYDIVNVLQENGIQARVIGKTTTKKARVLINDDEVSYINIPGSDEVYRLI